MMNFEVMQVSEEEVKMILHDRAEKARKAEIDECAKEITRLMIRVEELGGSARIQSNGHRYASCAYCNTTITAKNIKFKY